MQKKILFLGAAPTQIAPILYAKEEGHYVITCDYLPSNPGHKFANESHNLSTTDKEGVLNLSRKLRIDGIVAYASDPAAPTAAYVAEKMNLPGNPYSSVLTLARKDLFRDFLKANSFNTPKSQSFYHFNEALEWLKEIGLPAFIKPVDSSGSKGVTRLKKIDDFQEAFDYAINFSREKKVVVEQEVIRSGYQVAGDGFIVNGELVFRCWADEHFDKLCNGLVPIGQSFPTTHPEKILSIAHSESQRLIDLLGMKTGALNFDFIFDQNGNFYFLELGPRNGGCLIPEVIRYCTNTDLIKFTVDAALGIESKEIKMPKTQGFWSSFMIHSTKDGIYRSLKISEILKEKIIFQEVYIQPGQYVKKYSGSNDILGTMILKFKDQREMLHMIDNMELYLDVITE